MGAQLAQMGMGVVDAVMAGQYGSLDLAGVALGGSLFWPVMLLVMGLVQAVTPTVAQLNGAGRQAAIGEVIRQGLWLALVGGIAAAVILNNISQVYVWMSVDPAAAAISVPYLHMASFGVPALMCFFCLRFLADGMGFTRPALFISLTALCLKVPLNYVLIYGKFGAPEMGGVGAGLAQAIIMWLQLLLILIVVTRRRFRSTGWQEKFSRPDWLHIKRLLIIGVPIGATIFAEMGLFSLTTILLGRFGAETVGVTQYCDEYLRCTVYAGAGIGYGGHNSHWFSGWRRGDHPGAYHCRHYHGHLRGGGPVGSCGDLFLPYPYGWFLYFRTRRSRTVCNSVAVCDVFYAV